MKKIFWIPACLFTLAFILINSTHLDAKGHEEFKVAMLLPGSTSDAGWNALGYDGLKAVGKELGAKISHVESRTPTDQEAHFRDFALNGYHLIFGHGYEYQDPAKLVAPDFPETVFITSTGGTVTDNISPIVFRIEGATYLQGIIAGMMTQTDKVGIVGGQNIPAINSTFMAFEGGVKSVNPDAEVRWTYVGDWENISKGKELASALIEEGVDFIFHNADAAGRGVFEAAKVAQAEGKTVYAFGSNKDQSEVSPTTVLASAVVTPKVFLHVAKLVKEGTFKPKPYNFTIADDGAISMIYNPKLKDKVPEAVQKAVEEAKAKILAGELQVPQVDYTKVDNE